MTLESPGASITRDRAEPTYAVGETATCDYGKAWTTAESGNGHGPVSEIVLGVSRYYDAVNFARRIACPAVINLGLIDTCVPPTTAFSAYNVLQGPKTVVISPDLGHDADRNPEYRRDQRICEMAAQAGSAIVDN